MLRLGRILCKRCHSLIKVFLYRSRCASKLWQGLYNINTQYLIQSWQISLKMSEILWKNNLITGKCIRIIHVNLFSQLRLLRKNGVTLVLFR